MTKYGEKHYTSARRQTRWTLPTHPPHSARLKTAAFLIASDNRFSHNKVHLCLNYILIPTKKRKRIVNGTSRNANRKWVLLSHSVVSNISCLPCTVSDIQPICNKKIAIAEFLTGRYGHGLRYSVSRFLVVFCIII